MQIECNHECGNARVWIGDRMKRRAEFSPEVDRFKFVSAADLRRYWASNVDKNIRQCGCWPFGPEGRTHFASCQYFKGVQYPNAIAAAAAYLRSLPAGSQVPPGLTIQVVLPGLSVSAAQAELTLSFLTDPIEFNQAHQFNNGRHRATAIVDVAPGLQGIPVYMA